MFEIENKASYVTMQSSFQLKKKKKKLLKRSLLCILQNLYTRIFFKCVSLSRRSKANTLMPFKCYQKYLGHEFIVLKQIMSIKISIRGQCASNFYT